MSLTLTSPSLEAISWLGWRHARRKQPLRLRLNPTSMPFSQDASMWAGEFREFGYVRLQRWNWSWGKTINPSTIQMKIRHLTSQKLARRLSWLSAQLLASCSIALPVNLCEIIQFPQTCCGILVPLTCTFDVVVSVHYCNLSRGGNAKEVSQASSEIISFIYHLQILVRATLNCESLVVHKGTN